MTGLKTLKDLHEEDPQPCCGEIEVNKLRKEVINWIKDGRRKISIEDLSIDDIMYIKGGIFAFKIFFNLTEDDLK